jgi:hypothetical protein
LSIGLKTDQQYCGHHQLCHDGNRAALHAFDFDQLAENRIVVRAPRKDKEKFTTLDEKERTCLKTP